MPLELRNAPVKYQRAINTILTTVKYKLALVYLDQIIVFLSSIEAYKAQLRTVLELFETAGATLCSSKFKLFLIKMDYLGYVIKQAP